MTLINEISEMSKNWSDTSVEHGAHAWIGKLRLKYSSNGCVWLRHRKIKVTSFKFNHALFCFERFHSATVNFVVWAFPPSFHCGITKQIKRQFRKSNQYIYKSIHRAETPQITHHTIHNLIWREASHKNRAILFRLLWYFLLDEQLLCF